MTTTAIEWADKVWNPVTGCTKVSPGCAHCYAEGIAARFWGAQYSFVQEDGGLVRPREFTDVQTHPDRLQVPFAWSKGRVFVNSMSDLFHEDVPFEFIDQVMATIALCDRLTFQVLTKRHVRMRDYWDARDVEQRIHDAAQRMRRDRQEVDLDLLDFVFPLQNLWLGVSVENQRMADERVPELLKTRAFVRFISAEPLLGAVDISQHLKASGAFGECCGEPGCEFCDGTGEAEVKDLNQVIVGGESGVGARALQVDWARSLVHQCQAAGVAVFVKQLGSHVSDRNDAGYEGDKATSWPGDTKTTEDYGAAFQGDLVRVRLRNRKGGDMTEWPKDLRVREFPDEG